MAKRSQLEIYFDILKAVEKGTHKPTRIMYKCNLSWPRLLKYLGFMIEQELLKANEEDGRTTYEITEKGQNVVAGLERICEKGRLRSPVIFIPARNDPESKRGES